MALRILGRDVVVYGGTDLVFRSLQFLALPIYASQLDVAEFGVLALIQATCALLAILLNLGVNNSVQRLYFDDISTHSMRSSVVSTGLAQLLFSTTIGVAIIYAIAYALRVEIQTAYQMPWVWVSLALLTIVPEQVAQYTLDAARLQFSPLRFVIIAMIKNAVGVLLGLIFLLQFELGVQGILLGTLIAAFLAVPIGLWMISTDLTLRFDLAVALKIFRFGLPFVLAGAAYWILGSIDRWMLAEMSGIEQVGLLSVGIKFAAIPMFAIVAFGQAWNPFAYKLAASQSGYQLLFSQILSIWFFMLALVGLALSLFAREIMILFTPEAYWPASRIFSIVVCGVAIYGTTLVTALGVSITKRTIYISHAAWIAGLVNVVVNLLLIPSLGAVGAAIATLFAYIALATSMLYWCQKVHPLPIEWGKIGYSCALLVTALACSAFDAEELGAFMVLLKLLGLCLAFSGGLVTGIISPHLFCQVRTHLLHSKPIKTCLSQRD
jgi:O-antigen/teichoic acid export membrane protein